MNIPEVATIHGVPWAEAKSKVDDYVIKCSNPDYAEEAMDDKKKSVVIFRGIIMQPDGQALPTNSFCLGDGSIDEGITFYGRGEDDVGLYGIWGGFAPFLKSFEFCKHYDGKSFVVNYVSTECTVASEMDGRTVLLKCKGNWKIPGNWGHTFDFEARLWRSKGDRQSDDYEARVPRKVQVAFDDVQLLNLDTVGFSFEASWTTELVWEISALDVRRLALGEKGQDARVDWHPPEPDIINLARDAEPRCHSGQVSLVESDMLLVATKHIKTIAKMQEPFELQAFPFDCQDLPIKFEFNAFGSEHKFVVTLRADDTKGALSSLAKVGQVPEFTIYKPILELGSQDRLVGIGHDLKPAVEKVWGMTIRLKVQRKSASYINRIVAMLVLIELGAAAAFVMHPIEDFADRLAHVSTMFLSAVAFQFVVQMYTPNVDYMTVLDKYILTVNVHIVGVMIICALVAYFELDSPLMNALLLVFNIAIPMFILAAFNHHIVRVTMPKEEAKLTANEASLSDKNVIEDDVHFKVQRDAVSKMSYKELL